MELKVSRATGGEQAINVSDQIFACDVNIPLVRQIAHSWIMRGHLKNRKQKSRAMVSGSGRKPWRQKGTGKARAGSLRSPLWRGGGVTFAAEPGGAVPKVNRKMHRQAVRCIWADIVRDNRLLIVDTIPVDQPKTRLMQEWLGTYDVNHALIVIADDDRLLHLATRNIPNIQLCPLHALNPLDLMHYEQIIVTTDALQKLEQSLSNTNKTKTTDHAV